MKITVEYEVDAVLYAQSHGLASVAEVCRAFDVEVRAWAADCPGDVHVRAVGVTG